MPSVPMSNSASVVILDPEEPGERSAAAAAAPPQELHCRNFWKAGSFDAPSDAAPAPQETTRSSDFAHARVHPKFLHTNATSHKWAFGAVAELLDNSVDEICNGATFVKVDKINNLKDNSPMLLFQDDGGGMNPEGIRGCMSLGFSSKKSKTTIGQYGNGFKTSTMRLGADVIVFTRAIHGSRVTQSIGLLSYTYLRRTMKDDIIVPMIDFQILGDQAVPLLYGSQDDWDHCLKVILDWSPFSSKEELLLQFEEIGLHGTKVLIYNLWMNDDGLLELDFDDNDQDILLRDHVSNGGFSRSQKEIIQSHISCTHKYSLQAYASILYLRKFSKFQIILRGRPVQQQNIADELKFSKVVTYKPQVGSDSEVVSVRTTIGFAKEAPVLGIFGINVYHKNRLIMPFWKVLQEGSSRGRCVVGVLEANFMEPAHDKQDFERTPLFIRLELKLKQMVLDYWKDNCHLIGYQPTSVSYAKKGSDKYSHGVKAKVQQKVPATEHVVGLSASLQQECPIDEPIIELTNDFQGSTAVPSVEARALNSDMAPSVLREDLEQVDILDSAFIEKVTEENLQLFGRREELKRRQAELQQKVQELEQTLGKAKRKCAQAALELETRKKQHPTG